MNRYFLLNVISALVFLGSFSGCASIMTGTMQEMHFQSNPEGATVTVDGETIGQTPLTTVLKKKSSGPMVGFSKEGYKPLKMQMDNRINSWFWGNILIGGVLGSTTDNVTGAMNEYSPNKYLVTLQPAAATRLEAATSLSDAQKAREFIVVGYNQLIQDLKNGGGNYLSSLIQLLNIPPEDRDLAIKKIRALSEVYSNIPEFSEQVVDLYIKDVESDKPGSSNESPAVDPFHGSAPITLKKKTKITLGVDYFGPGNLDTSAKKAEEDGVAIVNFLDGFPTPSRKTEGGLGIRIGFLKPSVSLKNFHWGASVGYIPTLKTESNVYDSAFPPGNLITEIDNTYIRGLIEAGQHIPISNSVALKIGGGVGIGQGKTKQKFTGTGFYDLFGSVEFSKTSTGLTWEVSPAVVFSMGKSELEIGLRYAQFPKIKETDNTYEVNYAGLGAFAAFNF